MSDIRAFFSSTSEPRAKRVKRTVSTEEKCASNENEKTEVEAKSIDEDDTSGEKPNSTQVQLRKLLTEESWKEILAPEFQKGYFKSLQSFLTREYKYVSMLMALLSLYFVCLTLDGYRKAAKIYPPKDEIFAALNLCPFDKLKVVIIGQDPYHGAGQVSRIYIFYCISIQELA